MTSEIPLSAVPAVAMNTVTQSQPMETEWRASKRIRDGSKRVPRNFQFKGTKRGSATRKLKALVKREVEGLAEKKMIQYYTPAAQQPYTSVMASDFGAFNCYVLTSSTGAQSLYAIARGTDQGNRVGNIVKTHKCTLRMTLFANPAFGDTTNYNACPLYVTIWIVSLMPHLDDTLTSLTNVTTNTFFQASGSAAGFDGTLADTIKVPNKDQVRVYMRKTVKLGMGNYNSATGAGSANNNSQQFNNNDFSMSKALVMDITKHMPTYQKFNDGDNMTIERRRWLFFTSARADGNSTVTSLGFSTGTRPYQGSVGLDYQYTDI